MPHRPEASVLEDLAAARPDEPTDPLGQVNGRRDQIVVIDAGEIVARGTAEELKQRVGGQVLTAVLDDTAELASAAEALRSIGLTASVDPSARSLSASLPDASAVAATIRALDSAGVTIDRLDVSSPSLDDVFLAITGAGADDFAVA